MRTRDFVFFLVIVLNLLPLTDTRDDVVQDSWKNGKTEVNYNGADVVFGLLGVSALIFCICMWCCCCSPFATKFWAVSPRHEPDDNQNCWDAALRRHQHNEEDRMVDGSSTLNIATLPATIVVDQPPSYEETVLQTPPPAYDNYAFEAQLAEAYRNNSSTSRPLSSIDSEAQTSNVRPSSAFLQVPAHLPGYYHTALHIPLQEMTSRSDGSQDDVVKDDTNDD